MTMELRQAQELEFGAHQTMKVSPRLVAANYILEMSAQQLQQAIAAELDQNPAFELVEVPVCTSCGTQLQRAGCPRCIQRQEPTYERGAEDSLTARAEWSTEQRAQSSDPDEFDPMTRVAAEQTLAEKLLGDVGAVLPERDMAIAEYLVGSLDEKGYLPVSPEDVADALLVSEERVRRVLTVLQAQDPIGVGARNLRECLLLQIDALEQQGVTVPSVRDIVSMYLSEMGEHKFSRIAHELRVSQQVVADAWTFIKHQLNPYPGHGYSATNRSDRDSRSLQIRPEVIIHRTVTGGFDVEVVESQRFQLRVSSLYTQLAASLHQDAGKLSDTDRQHVHQYVGRARLFIANIHQRRQTLAKITACIAVQQAAYLDHGVRHLKPFSRARVAEELGIHESTVSRATAGKYAMLPNGEVVPFTSFFTPALSIKDVMREIIEREGTPLTDAQVAKRLAQQGIHIARRTVAKYRLSLVILRSGLR